MTSDSSKKELDLFDKGSVDIPAIPTLDILAGSEQKDLKGFYELAKVHREDGELDDLDIDPKVLKKALRKHRKLMGASPHETTIMLCAGEDCPMRHKCGLFEAKIHVKGETCPVEERDFRAWTTQFVLGIADRLGIEVDDVDIILQDMIIEIVSWRLIYRRASSILASQGMVREEIGFVTPNGKIFMVEKPSDMIDLMNKINRRIDALYRQLLLTPEMNEKYKKKVLEDVTTHLSKLVKRSFSEIEGDVNAIMMSTRPKKQIPMGEIPNHEEEEEEE